MASVFVLLEAFNRKEAAALGFFPCATASVVGSARFELTNAGVKVPCLTTWRRPIIKEKAVQERACTVFGGVPREIRTLGLQSHNLAR